MWIDSVQLYDLLFPLCFTNRAKKRGPDASNWSKLISAAKSSLENGELAECARMLEGYWPRFLNAYTPTKYADHGDAADGTGTNGASDSRRRAGGRNTQRRQALVLHAELLAK